RLRARDAGQVRAVLDVRGVELAGDLHLVAQVPEVEVCALGVGGLDFLLLVAAPGERDGGGEGADEGGGGAAEDHAAADPSRPRCSYRRWWPACRGPGRPRESSAGGAAPWRSCASASRGRPSTRRGGRRTSPGASRR